MTKQAENDSAVADALEALHTAVGSCPGSDTIAEAVAKLRGDTPKAESGAEDGK